MIKNKYNTSAAERDAALAKEIEEIENANVKQPDEGPEPKNAGEATWQKRYSDLRSHAQRRENEIKAEADELRRQLAAATQQEIKFPKTDAEIEAWANKYPDVAKIVDTYAMKRAKEMSAALDARVNEITEREIQSERRNAYLKLLEKHPDFEELVASQEFVEWVEGQPKYIYNALYVNDTDAFAAIRAVDLFKADTKPAKQKKEADPRDAARSVKTPPTGSPTFVDDGGWSESKMEKLSNRELEKLMPEIDEAIRTGKFVYDLSGGAR